MKRVFIAIIALLLVTTTMTFVVACQKKTETEDGDILICEPYFIGETPIKMECKKEYDINSVEVNCCYGYIYKNITNPRPEVPECMFDRVVLLYEFYTLENELREAYARKEAIEKNDRSKLDPIVTNDYHQLFNETLQKYHIVKEITNDEFLTDEYFVKRGGLLEYIKAYKHQEIIKIPKDDFLLGKGVFRILLLIIFRSEKENKYVVTSTGPGELFYTVDENNMVRFKKTRLKTSEEGRIAITDLDGNILIDDYPKDEEQEGEKDVE